MPSAELKIPVPVARDWILANPWFWMTLGLAGTALGWIWVLSLADSLAPAGVNGQAWDQVFDLVRFFLIGCGLLSVGAALRIR